MKDEELINLIEHDRKGALPKRDKQIERINKWIKIYDGEAYGNEDEDRSTMVWKLVKKQAESLISNLSKQFLGAHQIVELDPITDKDVFKSKIYSGFINHFWAKEFNSNKFIKTLTRVDAKSGTAIIRVGWEQNIEYDTQIVDDIPEQMIEAIQNAGATIERTEDGKFKITKKRIIQNRPTAKVVRLKDVLFDPTADSFEEAQFLIYEYTSDISTMAKQPHLYSEEAVKKLKKAIESNDDNPELVDENHPKNESNFEFSDNARKKIIVYEYWGEYDIDGTGITKPCVAVMARYGATKVIVRLEENKLPFKSIPFVCIPLIEEEFNIYGVPLAELIGDEQAFSTAIIRGIQDNISMSNKGTKFIKKNALDTTNYNRLISGEPVVEINTHEHINTAIMDGNFNPLPPSVFNMLSILDQQAESLTGISKFMQGIPGTEMKAASSNFSAVMSQSQIRLLDMTTSITTGLRQVFRMWVQMAVEYLDENEIQDITGIFLPEVKVKETKKLVAKYGIEELPPETQAKAMQLIIQEIDDMFDLSTFKFDVKMKVGTDGLKDIKINQINMLMQQAGNLVGAGVVPSKILGLLMADMAEAMNRPDIAKMIEEYEPQPDPMQQAMQQAELEEKSANTIKDKALAENALARTRNVDAKTQKDLAMFSTDKAVKEMGMAKTAKEMENSDYDTAANLMKTVKETSGTDQKQENA